MKPREATWLAWGYTASQQPRQSPYLPSNTFSMMTPESSNELPFVSPDCIYVFVCLHPSPVFPRKPNKPVLAFTLKLGVCNLDISSWLPRRAGSTGQKGRGLATLSWGNQETLYFQPELGWVSALTGKQVVLSKSPESWHPSQTPA